VQCFDVDDLQEVVERTVLINAEQMPEVLEQLQGNL
jgi:hypothetical protein